MNTWIVKIRLGGPTVKMLGRWISGFAAAAHALGLRDRPPLLTISRTIEVAERFWNCSCDRARKDLGFAPKIDIVEGSRLTVEWYRAHGWL
jgi:nucleoside-diphosphate-sugar epimerase